MTMRTVKSNLLYRLQQVETIAGHEREGEKERMRERGERVRDSVWLGKGFGIRHKFNSWSNFSELRES
jgi:hypothetical protein